MRFDRYQEAFLDAVRYEKPPADLVSSVVGGGSLGPEEAISVYRDMYWYRLVDAHFSLFPKSAGRLGKKAFTRLVCRCLASRPSTVPALERLAAPFASYVREKEELAPVYVDLIRLEALFIESLLSEDPSSPLREEHTQRGDFAELVLRPCAHVMVAEVRVEAVDLYEISSADGDPDDEPSEPPPTGEALCQVMFYRSRHAVELARLTPPIAVAIGREAIRVGELLSVLAGEDADISQAFTGLKWLIDHRIFEQKETSE